MSDYLMNFDGRNVEVFELNGQVLFNPKDVAEILEIADVKSSIRNFSNKQIVKVKNSDVHSMHFRKLNNAGENFLTESGVYKLVFKSRKPEAERFSDWVTDEVLPTMRKTGGYISNDDLFINTYLPFADEQTKLLFSTTLATVRNQNEIIQKQNAENKRLLDDNNHKQEIINGFTDDIDIYKKKDIINRICRRKHENYASRYTELYRCFRENNHIDLEARCEGYNLKQTKKKDKLSVIKYAEQFGHIDDLYSCCVKLYESEVKSIIEQLNELQN